MSKTKSPRKSKKSTPSIIEIYDAILATRSASLFGEHWEEAAQVLAPMALGDELSKVLKRFDLSEHPECRDLYELVAQHNRIQAGIAKAKMVAVNVLSARAAESPRLAN
jgi:hypothetical protein